MCEIRINEVIGIPDGNNEIKVKGTASNCKTMNVSIMCGDDIATQTISVEALEHSTSWEVIFSNEEEKHCNCNESIKVTANCNEGSDCNDQWENKLPCEEEPTIECPEISWSGITMNGCSVGIQAMVRYSEEYSAELRNSSNEILDSFSGSGETILSYNGVIQSEAFEVVILTPDGCIGSSLPRITPTCDQCPSIVFDYELSECNEDTCNLLVQATLNSSDSYTAILKDSNGVELDSVSEITGEHILSYEGSYARGSSQSFSISIDSPSWCSEDTYTVDIPESIKQCPKLSGISVSGCWPGNVTLQAEGTNLEYAENFDWDFGDGQSISNGPVVNHNYSDDCPDEVCLVTLTMQNSNDCDSSKQTTSVSVLKCPPPFTDCWTWFWINVGLFISTAIFIFITLCMIEANALVAVAAIASGGTLAAVWAALSVTNIVMILISIALILITLISFILWIIYCAFNLAKDIVCQMLTLLHEILLWLAGASALIAIALTFSGMVGCAIGAYIDVGWFAFLNIITWKVGQHLGCFPHFFSRKNTSIR